METFTGLGFMLGPPLGGVLYSAGGFKLPFIVLGSLLLSILPVVILILPRDQDLPQKVDTGLTASNDKDSRNCHDRFIHPCIGISSGLP